MSAVAQLISLSALLTVGYARHITGIFGSEHFRPAFPTVDVVERSQWGNVVPLFHMPLFGSFQHHSELDPNIRLLIETMASLRDSVLLLQRRQHQLYQMVLCSSPQAINCTLAVAPDFVSPFPSHNLFPGGAFFPGYSAGLFTGSAIPDGFFPGSGNPLPPPSGDKPTSTSSIAASSSVVGADEKETTTLTGGTGDKQPVVETVTSKEEGEKKEEDKKEEEKEKEVTNDTQ